MLLAGRPQEFHPSGSLWVAHGDNRMKPFLKWAGNKYRIIDHIKTRLPEGSRLVEPFAGAAAVFLNTDFPSYLIADSNSDVISLYRHLQREGMRFISYCHGLFTPDNNARDKYLAYREEFNATKNHRRRAALFLYLNRHGFNGLCRYNASASITSLSDDIKNHISLKGK
jgi:DNA adenine methylase